MASSAAPTVPAYLKELPPERRAVIKTVRALIRRHLPAGYREAMRGGMITYEIPLARYPETYNGQPLCYVALAAQKNFYALYLSGVYVQLHRQASLRQAFQRAGKKLDMGKSCLRFNNLDDLPLEVIGEVIASTPPEAMIEIHERVRAAAASKRARS